jgi:hypothetical protein
MSYIKSTVTKWGVLRRSCCKPDVFLTGHREATRKNDAVWDHLHSRDGHLLLFQTRQEAKDWINENYSYLDPYNYYMPKPVRVEIRALADWKGNKL